MKRLSSILSCLGFLLISNTLIFAQHITSEHKIYLKNRQFVPEKSESGIVIVNNTSSIAHKVIQFKTIPNQEQIERLENAGIVLLQYIPDYAYLASIAKNTYLNKNSVSSLDILSVVTLSTSDKIEKSLSGTTYPEWCENVNGHLDVVVTIFPDLSFDMEVSKLNHVGTIISESPSINSITLRIPIDQLQSLASSDNVLFIQPIASPEKAELDRSTQNHKTTLLKAKGYDGRGVKIIVADTDYMFDHADFKGRYDIRGTFSSSNHGTHVGGIVGGAGNIDPLAEGHATGAEIISRTSGAGTINSMPTEYSAGTRIQSASLGYTCNAGYDNNAQKVDKQIVDYASLSHVFSAGNSGSDDCGQYPIGWGNITGGYKQGKNVIAVGNIYHYDDLRSSSSRGPAEDGRIKPDICATGSSVYSTIENNGYSVKSGTSMACPAVAGSLAQLYQAFKANNNGTEPKSGLIKSILLNTADDLENEGPDFKTGWGKINNLKALRLIEDNRFITASASNGTNNSHNIPVPSNVDKLKVMVYWTDPEGSTSASKFLVNDLDITLQNGGTTHLPWQLAVSETDVNVLNAPATKGSDHTNNMEQVVVNTPTAGTYTLNVNGFIVPQGPQEYFVTYEYIYNTIEVTYPNGNEGLVPGESEYIRWDASGTTGSFLIEYSTNNGTTWSTISSSVAGSSRYYTWTVPSSSSDKVKVRVSRLGLSDESDNNFAIIDIPTNIAIDWVCDDGFLASWSPVSGATEYVVYKLGAEYMDVVGTTNSTSLAIPTSLGATEYYSVAAKIGNIIGRRATAEIKSGGAVGCPNGKDISVSNIPIPNAGLCLSLGDQLTISADVRNGGSEDVSVYSVSYQINGGAIITENVTTTLIAGNSTTHTFNTPYTTTLTGINTLNISVSTTGDIISSNDNASIDFNVGGNSSSLPLVESFDNESTCATSSDCETTVCPLTTWVNLTNAVNDDIDWRVNSGTTVSTATGPSQDHTTGTGNYIYLEASSCFGSEAILESPCVSNVGELSFWYHMYGGDMGTLHVDVISGSGTTADVAIISGDQGNAWKNEIVNLSAFIGQTIKIRFRGVTGTSFESDISIDDIELRGVTLGKDAAITAVISPVSSICTKVGEQLPITAIIENKGTEIISNYSVSYQINGGTPIVETINTALTLGETKTYTFNTLYTSISSGIKDILVTVIVNNDVSSSNDSYSSPLYVENSFANLPLTENFDNESTCATTTNCEATSCPLTTWNNLTNGTDDAIDWRVNSGTTASTVTGPSGDHTTGSANYIYLEASTCYGSEAILESPCLEGTNQLSFWYHMYGDDMGSLSVDIVTPLGIITDVFSLSGDQGDIWSQQTIDLSAYTNQVIKVRFRGITGTSFNSDIALDDINITGSNVIINSDRSSAVNCETITYSTQTSGSNFSWNFGLGAQPASAIGKGPHQVNYLTTGSKTVSLTVDGNGITEAGIVNISQDQTKIPSINLSTPLGNPICENSQFDVLATVTNAALPTSIDWYLNGVLVSNGSLFSSSTLNNGDEIYCTATGNDPCSETTTSSSVIVQTNVCTGFEGDITNTEINLLPNPTSNIVRITLSDPSNRIIDWKLYSLTGIALNNGKDLEINLSSQNPGIYFIKVNTSKGLIISKIKKL